MHQEKSWPYKSKTNTGSATNTSANTADSAAKAAEKVANDIKNTAQKFQQNMQNYSAKQRTKIHRTCCAANCTIPEALTNVQTV